MTDTNQNQNYRQNKTRLNVERQEIVWHEFLDTGSLRKATLQNCLTSAFFLKLSYTKLF